ncbi:SCO5717 family growth-regulating ATPase [Streptomyces albidoflavus]
MSSDRDGFRGGGNTPVDDQADVESAAETTGEYTFSADAWYTAEASSSGGVAPFSGGGSGDRAADGAGDGADGATGAERDGAAYGARDLGVSSSDGAGDGAARALLPERDDVAGADSGINASGEDDGGALGADSFGADSLDEDPARDETEAGAGDGSVRTTRRGKKGTGRARARRRGVRPRPVRRCRRPTSTSRSRPVGWARAVPPWWPPGPRPRRGTPSRAEAPGTTCPRRGAGRGACWRS